MNALEILQKYYGYSSFRLGQEELINCILKGRDVLGIMPTGGGKSICYQVPALLMEGITIVISPLISLMKDQVDTLKEYGIAAELINSSLTASEFREVIDNAREGKYKLLYVAPERLETSSFIDLLETLPISMIAVDEAHCVSQWGHDFRPSYTRVARMIKYLPIRPVIAAFTATATELVQRDISSLLELENPYKLITSFDRKNLYFEVQKPSDKFGAVRAYIEGHPGESGIIYCTTRKSVDAVCEKLVHMGIPATKYHAGLGENERSKNQEAFLYDKAPIMVATNAFGMGIDKSNVRFVLHYNMPKNMESYYQEAGRAGRDGEKSECILLFSAQDIMTNRLLIENGQDTESRGVEYQKLNDIVDYCNTDGCLRIYILGYFGEVLAEKCEDCGNCNNTVESTSITVEAQKIMSCIKRMKEQFGSGIVVDVLKGANTQKIRSMHFEELTTYGIMRDYPKDTIKEIISFLIAEGYIELAGDKYPVLRLGEASYEVLKGMKEVYIKRVLVKQQVASGKHLPVDSTLFEELRRIRAEIASEQHVPPFMIFSDTTLKDMCKKYPTTREKMGQVSGVGEFKLEKYGEAFIVAVVDYIEENQIDITQQDSYEIVQNETKVKTKDSYKLTYDLYLQGKPIREIAKERDLSITTIESHLIQSMTNGLELDYRDFVPEEQENLIVEAIHKCGMAFLKPIKEALPEEVSYTAIKFMVARCK
ncbi:MAG: DNA helicase RecQ [Cellulosilyticaceae bacterium]